MVGVETRSSLARFHATLPDRAAGDGIRKKGFASSDIHGCSPTIAKVLNSEQTTYRDVELSKLQERRW